MRATLFSAATLPLPLRLPLPVTFPSAVSEHHDRVGHPCEGKDKGKGKANN